MYCKRSMTTVNDGGHWQVGIWNVMYVQKSYEDQFWQRSTLAPETHQNATEAYKICDMQPNAQLKT